MDDNVTLIVFKTGKLY